MPAKAAVRSGAARRAGARKAISTQARVPADAPNDAVESDEWTGTDDERSRLEEGEMEILLTGHAATHGIEGEDNWLIKTEEESWGER